MLNLSVGPIKNGIDDQNSHIFTDQVLGNGQTFNVLVHFFLGGDIGDGFLGSHHENFIDIVEKDNHSVFEVLLLFFLGALFNGQEVLGTADVVLQIGKHSVHFLVQMHIGVQRTVGGDCLFLDVDVRIQRGVIAAGQGLEGFEIGGHSKR